MSSKGSLPLLPYLNIIGIVHEANWYWKMLTHLGKPNLFNLSLTLSFIETRKVQINTRVSPRTSCSPHPESKLSPWWESLWKTARGLHEDKCLSFLSSPFGTKQFAKKLPLHVKVHRCHHSGNSNRICEQDRICDLLFTDWDTSIHIILASDIHYFIFYIRWIELYCVYVSHFRYAVFCWWALKLVSYSEARNIDVHVYL